MTLQIDTEGFDYEVIKMIPFDDPPRIIRIDDDVLEWFRERAHAAGGGSYQAMINAALREFVVSSRESLRTTLRTVIREELTRYGAKGMD